MQPNRILRFLLMAFFVGFFGMGIQAQNVGIGTQTPHGSAQLEVSSTTQGMLLPRMTTAEMHAIAGPATGLLVYNTDSAAFAYRNAGAWVYLRGNINVANGWSTLGNAGTDPANNFMGTTGNQDLVFKRNNIRAGLLSNDNTSWGVNALAGNTIGYNNTANGSNALRSNTTGFANTANGFNALSSNTTGNLNTANGRDALRSNTSGEQNTANGVNALRSNTTGFSNTANGASSLYNNITGHENTANGVFALYSNNIGRGNTANGVGSLYFNTGGSGNTANGGRALFFNSTGSGNTASGDSALYSNATGSNNTSDGKFALRTNTTGSNNTAVGYLADVTTGNLTNATAIGANARVACSNCLVLGNNANVGIGTDNPKTPLQVDANNNSWIAGNFGNNITNKAFDRVVIGNLSAKATVGGHTSTLGEWATLLLNPGGSNVGIGTFAPDPLAKLDVNGKIKTTGLQLTTGAAAGRILQSDADGNATWATVSLTETDPKIGANTTNFFSKWNGTQLVAGGLREDGGNVGLGTAAAANARLQVNSANPGTGTANWIAANMGSSGANADRLVMGTLAGKAAIGGHTFNLSGWADLTLNPDGGNVGVRTASPAAGFDVQAPTIRLGVNGDNFRSVQTFEVSISELALGVNGSGTFVFNATAQNGTVNSKSAVFVNSWGVLPSGVVIAYCWAAEGNTINIRFQNTIAEARTIPAGTYKVTAINFE